MEKRLFLDLLFTKMLTPEDNRIFFFSKILGVQISFEGLTKDESPKKPSKLICTPDKKLKIKNNFWIPDSELWALRPREISCDLKFKTLNRLFTSHSEKFVMDSPQYSLSWKSLETVPWIFLSFLFLKFLTVMHYTVQCRQTARQARVPHTAIEESTNATKDIREAKRAMNKLDEATRPRYIIVSLAHVYTLPLSQVSKRNEDRIGSVACGWRIIIIKIIKKSMNRCETRGWLDYPRSFQCRQALLLLLLRLLLLLLMLRRGSCARCCITISGIKSNK